MTTSRTDWRTRLGIYRQMKIRRVDLVPAGANPLAHVTLAKSTDIQERPMPLPEALADLTDDQIAGIGTYVTDLAAALEAERAKVLTLTPPDPDEALKSAPPELVERIQKAEQAAKEATEKAEAVTKAERSRVFTTKAAALVNLSGGDDGATKLGAILEQVEKALSPEDYTELERVLTAADTQITKAEDLFKTHGSDSGEPASWQERADQLQAEGMERVDALKQARRENPDD